MGLAIAIAAPAYADVVSVPSDPTLIDPTSFHVSNSSSSSATIDPVPITSATQFFILDNDNQTIPAPLDVFFAVPTGSAPPTITSATFSGGPPQPAFGAVTDTLLAVTAGTDLYTLIGCSQCDNSLSFTNFQAGDTKLGLPKPTSYEIYEAVAPLTQNGWQGFNGKDNVELFGTFAQGTYIAPLGFDSSKIYDTSFTNAGVVVVDAPTVPEPSTWAMMLAGFGMLGFAAMRKGKREARLAV
jgi:hypothetical protein